MPAQQGVSCVLPSALEQLKHNGHVLHVSVSSSAYVATWIQIWDCVRSKKKVITERLVEACEIRGTCVRARFARFIPV